MLLPKLKISKQMLALLLISVVVFLAACTRAASDSQQTGAQLRLASAAETRNLSRDLKVEILRTNTDSLGNTRLVVKIDNISAKPIGRAQVTFRDAGDTEKTQPVGEAVIEGLAPGEPVTISVSTTVGADEIVARDLQREITKIWLAQ